MAGERPSAGRVLPHRADAARLRPARDAARPAGDDLPRPPATSRDLLTSPVTSRALFCRSARSAPSRTTRTATRTPSTGCRARPTCRWPTCPAAAPSASRGVSPLRLELRSFRQRLTRVHVPAATGTMHFGNATPTQQARCWEELQRLGFRQQRSSVKMPPPSSGLAGDPMPVACRLSCSGLPSGLWRGPRPLSCKLLISRAPHAEIPKTAGYHCVL